jgi:iron complex transport system permease protein
MARASAITNSRAPAVSKGVWISFVALPVLIVSVIFAVGNGTLEVSPWTTLTAIQRGVMGLPITGLEAIVWQLRLPRVVMAVLVGACLAVAGAGLQGLFRNPLADPYLLGIASGSSLGATLAILGVGGLGATFSAAGFDSTNVSSLVPLAAFVGGALAVLATLVLSGFGRRGSESILLAGVVVGGLCVSLSSYLLLQDSTRMRAVLSWTMGNLSFVGYGEVLKLLPYALIGGVALLTLSKQLDALQLGDDTARTLGIDLTRAKTLAILASSLVTAGAVSFVGIIGFVGLIAPHIARRFGAVRHAELLPASALIGATLLVLADLGARVLVRPEQLPVGLVTTLIGGPFFLWVLWRRS